MMHCSRSIAQFDVLSNLVAIDDANSTQLKVFYTNFARFRQDRVQPVVEKLCQIRRCAPRSSAGLTLNWQRRSRRLTTRLRVRACCTAGSTAGKEPASGGSSRSTYRQRKTLKRMPRGIPCRECGVVP